ILWHAFLDPSQGLADTYSSPVVWNGSVYVGISGIVAEEHEANVRLRGAVIALDAATGALRWRLYTVPAPLDGGAVWSTPALDGRPLVGELAKNGMYWALDRRTMTPVWSRAPGTLHTGGTLASTAFDGTRIYGQDDNGQVWALARDGRRLWVTSRSGSVNF